MDYGDFNYDLERCRDMLDGERYREAFELASDLVDRAGGNPEVVSVFCDAALAAGNAAAAVRACRRFLRSGLSDTEVREWLIRALWDLHLTEECRRACRELLAEDPTNYSALDYGLASILELGDFQDGEDIVQLAESVSDDRHLTYQTAVVRMMRGEDEWARETFERFLADEPDEPGTYINLMRIHHLAERYEEVLKLYHEAESKGIDHEDLHFNMGLALKAREEERVAVRYFIKAVRQNALLPDAHFHLGQILRNEGHPGLALAMLQRELAVDDTLPAVHAEMAWCAEDLEQFDEGVRMIRAAVERAPDWGVYQHSLAELMLRAGEDSAEAERVARQAVELDPDHAAGWQVLGRMAAEREEYRAAERMLRRAVKSRDSTAEDEGWLGLLLAEDDRRSDARPLLERAARTFPFWTHVGDALGRIRGHPLPCRFEVVLKAAGEARYRVLHVVAPDEDVARRAAARRSPDEKDEETFEVEEVRPLGFELDHEGGVVWDSGPTHSRFPHSPHPKRKA